MMRILFVCFRESEADIPEFKPKTFDWGHGGAPAPAAPIPDPAFGVQSLAREPAFGGRSLAREPAFGGLAQGREPAYGSRHYHESRGSSLLEGDRTWSPHSRGE